MILLADTKQSPFVDGMGADQESRLNRSAPQSAGHANHELVRMMDWKLLIPGLFTWF
jgi:hypothetical protein